jgi:hypothetical protein
VRPRLRLPALTRRQPPGHGSPYAGGAYQNPYQAPYQSPDCHQGQWQNPYTPPANGPGGPERSAALPPDPSAYWRGSFWRRGAPVGAIVLIALGTLFLLGQLDIFNGRLIEYSWPVFLIGLGVWLVVRRLGESQGGPK